MVAKKNVCYKLILIIHFSVLIFNYEIESSCDTRVKKRYMNKSWPLWPVTYRCQSHSFKACLLERSFHPVTINDSFPSLTDMRSHNLPLRGLTPSLTHRSLFSSDSYKECFVPFSHRYEVDSKLLGLRSCLSLFTFVLQNFRIYIIT